MGVRPNILISVVFHALVVSAVIVSGGSDKAREKNHIMVALIDGPAEIVTRQNPDIGRGSADLSTNSAAKPTEQPETSSPNVPDERSSVQLKIEKTVEYPQNREESAITLDQRKQDILQGSVASAVSHPVPVNRVVYKGNTGRIDGKSNSKKVDDSYTLNAIRTAIDKEKKYPLLARKRGIEGTVYISFRISPHGEPEDLRILKGSGSNILDNATIAIVKKAAPFPGVDSSVEIPVVFRLTD